MLSKPELLLPAGNVESFRAAIKGGADAVYLGFRQFNARVRAYNFVLEQFPALLQEAKNKNIKIYITLNTVIKNNELPQIAEILAFLDKVKPDGVIIQDWGVFYLIKQLFPGLNVHASTQMGNHNSVGVDFSHTVGFLRVVLARELTMTELGKIARNALCELEVFIHGALCYSMSGNCYFSSYIGGRGANRGMCSQSCRMVYNDGKEQKYIFNLKDNQQISNIQQLAAFGVHSLKVEGRMRSADYVYQVAKSYRMAIDSPEKQESAKDLLSFDFGREKISYFLGNDVKNAFATDSNTGIKIGTVSKLKRGKLTFFSSHSLQNGDRIRIIRSETGDAINLKIQDLTFTGSEISFKNIDNQEFNIGDVVFWIGRREESFPSRLPNVPSPVVKLSQQQKQFVVNQLVSKEIKPQPGLFIRIDDPAWLNFFRNEDYTGIVLSFSLNHLNTNTLEHPFIIQNKDKIFIELPKFIGENQLENWKTTIKNLESKGFRKFFISHLSQKLLIGSESICYTNEQVYVFNDASVKYLGNQNVEGFCYPVENDMSNLKSMQNRQGIIILHTIPELFYSRMPVKIDSEEGRFKDSFNNTFVKKVENGMTAILPDKPVNLFHLKKQFENQGFTGFMIDLKHQLPSLNFLKKCMVKFLKGEQIQPSTSFNYKRELI